MCLTWVLAKLGQTVLYVSDLGQVFHQSGAVFPRCHVFERAHRLGVRRGVQLPSRLQVRVYTVRQSQDAIK